MIRKPLILLFVLGALTLSACATTLSEPVTEEIRVPLPDGNTPTVNLEIPVGDFEIESAPANDALVSGTIRYNIETLKPKIDDLRVYQQTDRPINGENAINEWRLSIATVPMSLNVLAGASNGSLELGGMALENLYVSAGAADVDVNFAEPLQTALINLNVDSGASEVNITNLGNASPRTFTVDNGAGSVLLDFGGDLQNDVNGSIDTGASTINLRIPAGFGALINVDGGPNDVSFPEGWTKNGNTYTHNADGDSPQITININAGASDINISY